MLLRRLLPLVGLLLLLVPEAAEAQRRRLVGPPPAANPANFDEWLRLNAVKVDSAVPRDDDSDLVPLLRIIGNARIFGAGEATHGSAEFQTMKDRLFRFLAERKGFTVFAIEGSLPEADAVNDYVHGGPGTAADTVRGMHFWTWSTTEMDAMVEWMRAYNLAHPDRPQLSYRGFDMQYSQDAIARIDAYLARVDPAAEPALKAKLECINLPVGAYGSLPVAQQNECRANVVAVHDAIASSREAYAAASSQEEYERMLRYARVVVQNEDVFAHPENFALRDRYMAENAAWIAEVEHPGAKVMLWAHNGHIAIQNGGAPMGAYTKDHFGEDYIAAGFLFDRGSYTARDAATTVLGVFSVNGAPGTGFERHFKGLGYPQAIADLRAVPPSGFATIYGSSTIWAIGASSTAFRATLAVRYSYDVLVWIEELHATHLVGF
jgi:erythromycin esterase